MAKTTPATFVRQVRQELARVTWPTRRETTVTTAMVLIMVAVLSVFFFVVDQGLAWGVRVVLGIGA